MYHNKVELCGINTAQLPVLTEREKAQLLRRVKQGDRQARQEMIQGNLRLVLSVVQRFSGRGENLDDLFQVGCIGLIKAIDNFEPDMNLRFSTYGVPMIIGEIRRFLRDNNAPAGKPLGAGCGISGDAMPGAAAEKAGTGTAHKRDCSGGEPAQRDGDHGAGIRGGTGELV